LSWQFDIIGLNGTRRQMETHAVPIELEDGMVGQLAITRDISDRKKAEEELFRANSELGEIVAERTRVLEETATRLGYSERAFSLLVSSVVDYAIYMLDLQGRVVSWNAGAECIKGYSAAEITGEHFSRFYTAEDRELGLPQKGLEAAAVVGRFESEGWRVRKDGRRIWASVVIDAIKDDGELIGYAKVTRDMTEKRAAEERLRQAERLQALGQFTGGAAHNFNNLLMAVTGSLELLRKRLPEDERSRALLNNALEGAKRGAALTQRMLAFARRQELHTEVLDVSVLVEGMTPLLRQTIGPEFELEISVPTDLPWVKTDPTQLENALLNLVVNARDAMPGGGKLTVAANEARNLDLGELPSGRYIAIVLADNGGGMDAETLAHVREPFFTTKGVGKGTGLGLSMVDGLAAQSGGKLMIISEVGQGTTVEILLPAQQPGSSQVLSDTKPATSSSPQVHRKLKVLAVDDDALVLMNTVGMLEELGHHVLEAMSGLDALEILDREGPVDLVITDQGMPQMTGLQLAKAVREGNPDLPVIIATGYAELPSGADQVTRLAKPFSLAQLSSALTTLQVN
jgi:PAS domain S-box-containing protein